MKPQTENARSHTEEIRSAAKFQFGATEESSLRNIRMLVLAVLTVQNCSLTMVTSYSRSVSGPKYLASTAVVANELLKTTLVILQLVCKHGVRHVLLGILPRMLSTRTLKYAIPAVFYIVQNNLWFYAMDNLDSVTVAVTSQLKVLTTAVFSVIILSRRLSHMHWFALCVLVWGLVIMEYKGEARQGAGSFYYGLGAMMAACTSSGFAGVYLELLFKQLDVDIWQANLQLQLFCLPVAALGMFADVQNMRDRSPFYGWDYITCIVVVLNALGGFLVSFTMKYADNILKTFAVSISLVANCALSSLALGAEFSAQRGFGVLLVILSTWLYSIGARFLSPEEPRALHSRADPQHGRAGDSAGGNSKVATSPGLSPVGRPADAYIKLSTSDVESGTNNAEVPQTSANSPAESVGKRLSRSASDESGQPSV